MPSDYALPALQTVFRLAPLPVRHGMLRAVGPDYCTRFVLGRRFYSHYRGHVPNARRAGLSRRISSEVLRLTKAASGERSSGTARSSNSFQRGLS